MLKDKHIAKLCAAAEDFVAETLCPMLEEMTSETCGEEFRKNLFATMMTVGTEIPGESLKIVKKGDKYVIVKRGADDDEAEEEEEDEDEEKSSAKDKKDAMGDEISALVAKIVRCAKKYADDSDDFASIIAATAATIAELGGKKAKRFMMVHLNTDIGEIIKHIVEAI